MVAVLILLITVLLYFAAVQSNAFAEIAWGRAIAANGDLLDPVIRFNDPAGSQEYPCGAIDERGFALIAWPADYGSSGVMTFLVNQDGVVFQKDLGEDTAVAVESIQAFDPDGTWTAIAPPAEAPAT